MKIKIMHKEVLQIFFHSIVTRYLRFQLVSIGMFYKLLAAVTIRRDFFSF